MEEKLTELLHHLSEKMEYYNSIIRYEQKFDNTKVVDVIYARREELDYVTRELQRIINSNPPHQ